MNDKSNILGSFMGPTKRISSSEAKAKPTFVSTCASLGADRANSTGNTSKQHKLKQRFTVIRKLGKGTYGKVQLAINKETGQEVAIKTIKKSKIENEQDLQRVRREIQIMSSIEHPHIIHIYEVFENKDKIVLVMQYAPGGELYEYVSEAKILDDAEARRLFRQIATAIYYCHKNKICHRDLKLENILLDEKNNAKIADFGLSNVFDKRRQLKTFCGSPLYASPEIVQGSPYEGPEVDCWSLGVLLYTLVYGAMPFDGSNFKRLVKQISESSYYEPKQKSLASPLIKRLLCADPNKRATIVDVCADAWVNGLCATGNNNEHSAALPSHNPLLKVAQDLANLTPVRFDILLALAPTSPPVLQAAKDARPPLMARTPFNEASSINEASENSGILPLDSSIIELDEQRVNSSVASYVVRDIPSTVAGQSEIDPVGEKENSQPVISDVQQAKVAEVIDQQNIDNFSEINITPESTIYHPPHKDPSSEKIVSASKQDGELVNDKNVVAEMMELDDHHKEELKVESTNSSQVTAALEFNERGKLQSEGDEEIKLNKDQPKVEQQIEKVNLPEQMTKVDEAKQQVNTSKDIKEDSDKIEVAEKITKEQEDSSQAPDEPENKPKKKKKIVIVKKKKKKLSKKEETTDDTVSSIKEEESDKVEKKDLNKEDKQAKKLDEASTKSPENQSNLNSKAPGKVRIPDNFTQQTSTAESEIVPAQTQVTCARRPSALVVDVTQRLLQSASPTSSPSAGVGCEDSISLASARVSDKRDEFERRASQVNALSSPLTKVAPSKLEEAELLRELIAAIQRGEIELVEKVSPTRIDPILSKLTTLKDKCEDDNNTSSETIRPDSDTIRSMLISSPGGAKQEVNDKESQQQQQQLQPAPIARSYKKVTFTKDGACITETGKIYSSRGDDGAIRRVERKSKVTHFPAINDAGISKSSVTQEVWEEERSSSSMSQRSRPTTSTWPFKHTEQTRGFPPDPFENLVTPLAAAQVSEEGGENDDQLVEESFPRLLSRADSCSSCSSGSTDAFDDIFDTWTGAARGMLTSRPPLHRLSSGLFGNRRRGHHTSSISGRHSHRSPNSVAGSPRCTSALGDAGPLTFESASGTRPAWSAHSSGYDSDVPATGDGQQKWARRRQERPSSAIGEVSSSRHRLSDSSQQLFSSILNNHQDPFSLAQDLDDLILKPDHQDTTSLSRGSNQVNYGGISNLSQEHAELRRRISEQHKQLWKGSSPSLFAPLDDLRGFKESTLSSIPSSSNSSRPPLPRSGSGVSGSGNIRVSEFLSGEKQINPPNEMIEQSRSTSSSFVLRHSIALDPKPRRTPSASAQLPPTPQPVYRSMSRGSVISTQLAGVELASGTSPGIGALTDRVNSGKETQHSSSTFIELKRTNSTLQRELQQQQQQIKTIKTTKVISTSKQQQAASTTDAVPVLYNSDSRIQNWLDDSPGNEQSATTASNSSFSSWKGSKTSKNASFSSSQILANEGTPIAALNSNRAMFTGTPIGTSARMRSPELLMLEPQSQSQLDSSLAEECDPASASSFSLLDQLRSRGYRSMMNQRMTSEQQVAAGSSIVNSDNSTRIIQQSTTSVSSSSSLSSRNIIHHRISTSSQQQTNLGTLIGAAASTTATATTTTSTSSSSSLIREQGVADAADLGSNSNSTKHVEVRIEATTIPKVAPGSTIEIEHDNFSGTQDAKKSACLDEEDDDEDDEDLKAARASIKANVERMRETELFLKSLQQVDEHAEEKRKQSLLFDNLLLSARLNATGLVAATPSCLEMGASKGRPLIGLGSRSAPVWPLNPFSSSMLSATCKADLGAELYQHPSRFASENYTDYIHDDNYYYSSGKGIMLNDMVKPVQSNCLDPLEPIAPLQVLRGNSSYRPASLNFTSTHKGSLFDTYTCPKVTERELSRNFGRSKSQLSDQFSGSNARRRPMSMNLSGSNELDWCELAPGGSGVNNSQGIGRTGSNRRSLSQMREPSLKLGSATFASQSRAYTYFPRGKGGLGSGAVRWDQEGVAGGGTDGGGCGATNTDEEEDDDGMSEYRAASYVPKVVPQGTSSSFRSIRREEQYPKLKTSGRSERSYERRSVSEAIDNKRLLLDGMHINSTLSKGKNPTSEVSEGAERVSLRSRRSSIGGDDYLSCEKNTHTEKQMTDSSSRLSQLEQRLLENRRRREELLSGAKSRECSAEPTSRKVSVESGTHSTSRLNRPSRLESMEARIKRRSYCITPRAEYSPERPARTTLERWSRARAEGVTSDSAVASSSSSRRNSMSGLHSTSKMSDNSKPYQMSCDDKIEQHEENKA